MSCTHSLDEDSKVRARTSFLRVLKLIYGRGVMDRIALESRLDELSYFFGIELTPGEVQVRRSPERYDAIDPVQYNRIFKGL